MLAFALNDPAFSILYVSVVAVLTLGILFVPGSRLGWLPALQLLAVAALGFFLGLTVRATRSDLSGAPPVALPRPGLPAGLHVPQPPLRTGPVNPQISVDDFDIDSAARPRKQLALTIPRGTGFTVEGWAYNILAHRPCAQVDVVVDGRLHAEAVYGVPRRDVAAFLNDEGHLLTGYSALVATSDLSAGTHTVRVECVEPANGLALPASQSLRLTITAKR